MGFSKQEYLENPGIKLVFLMIPAVAVGFFTTWASTTWVSTTWASLVAQMVKNLPLIQETGVQSPGWEDSFKKGIMTHSSILAWKISQTVKPDRL